MMIMDHRGAAAINALRFAARGTRDARGLPLLVLEGAGHRVARNAHGLTRVALEEAHGAAATRPAILVLSRAA